VIEGIAGKFYARFSANSNSWYFKLDDVEIEVRNLIVASEPEVNLKQNFQDITGKDVTYKIIGDCFLILNCTELKKVTMWSDLFNPDMPRNLAKSVTVR